MGIKESRELLCTLTDDEVQVRKDRHYEVSRTIAVLGEEKSAWLSAFRAKLKPHKDEEAELRDQIDKRGELREVECEWRDGLVNGVTECVRLDTGEVIDTHSDDPEDDAPQERLPFAGKGKSAPELRCTAIDADGVPYLITAEQADAADRQIADQGHAMVAVDRDGPHVRVEKIVRGRACEFCGQADGHHRQPECDDARAEADAEGSPLREVSGDGSDPEPEDDDPNDTSDLAMRLAESPLPSDEPLVPNDPSTKPPPKRTRKGANGASRETH